ncbi:acyl-CoA dehydrogenase family protein [Pseudonocardia bannensis]|uniref:Oxidoreductase n=1 Tax=Pseudonocardia bannensis TaxID=630973 RepID=A0A848DCQ5_9PSEU|nr:acyl-CoA dehydrogenase family protein [Pseudonocardia bannensis]NMH90388.1 oxidoreductase [Pseudonocardia bannensis]
MDPVDVLTLREELIEKATALHPLLAKNADEAEKQRSLPDENFKALVEAGMLRLCTPRRYGGLEAGHRTYLDVVAELARSGCGASSWYGFILNMTDWIVGGMHQEAQDAVWGDSPDNVVCCPLTPSPGWKARRVPGGVRLSGEWGYTSGCMHASWALLGFPVLDDADNIVDSAVALVPMSEITIKDTWNVIGMSGTGSNTLVVDDAFVPDNLTMDMSGPLSNNYPTSHPEEHMFLSDPAATFWTCVHPSILGLAQAALELTQERMTAKPKPITYTFYQDATRAPSVQFNIAQAAIMIDAATLQARAAADEIDAQSRTGQHLAPADRHRNIMRSANMVRLCRGAVDLLLDVQGAGAFALANPLQRIWRDLNACSRHGFNAAGVKHEIYGRSLLGADEQQMTAFR